jgi:peptidoglycan/xylan/chitin deacetylase (PgdA/CDA1 family)
MRAVRGAGVARRLGQWIHSRPVRVAWPGGVVSFTFDDFPKSALAAGGRILERYGARGTYYTSMMLAGTEGILGSMFDEEDILVAHRMGHEIACHTYTHLDCRSAAKSLILAEIRDNAGALSPFTKAAAPMNFAYPYGSLSATAKRVLAPRFSSCRGIERGINHGIADFADLLARDLYAADFDDAALRCLIDCNRSVEGWLIFYTHDVASAPSPYGCTPEQLEAIVAYAAERTTILPVREVIAGLRSGQPSRNSWSVRYSFVMKQLKRYYIFRNER